MSSSTPHHSRRNLPARFAPRRLALALAACSLASLVHAGSTLPTGLQVLQGQATAVTNGNKLTVTNSNGAILNWSSFSIGAQNTVRFDQASASSKVLNRVTGNDPSNILGSLSSNGQVWLLNPNGVLFGQGARIDVASLVTSTLNLNNQDWSAGRYLFSAPVSGSNGAAAGITNQGEIRSAAGGQVVLIGAGEVRNEGLIETSGGQIVLAAGASVELLDTATPRFSVKVSAPLGEVVNLGQLSAAGGRIDVVAASVNQQGIVRADALGVGPAGEIVMNAGQRLTLAAGSSTSADASAGQGGQVQLLGNQVALQSGSGVSASGATGGGTVLVGGGAQGKDASVPNADAVYFAPGASIHADAQDSGDGGHIVLWSNSATRAYGSLSAVGGPNGGNGGLVETSGGWLDARLSKLDVSAPRGTAGTWLLDPFDVLITDNPSQEGGFDQSFTANSESAQISTLALVTALSAGTNVTVQTGLPPGGDPANSGSQPGTITVSGAHFNVNSPTTGSLTLVADADINVTNSSLFSQNPLALNLQAGRSGQGSISVSNSTLSTGGGDITMGGQATVRTPERGTLFIGAEGGEGTGLTLSGNTLLDAGTTGKINLAGRGDSGGVLLDDGTNLKGFTISVIGDSSNGFGVRMNSASLTSVSDLNVQGYSDFATGVSITGTSILRIAPDPNNFVYSQLYIAGLSGENGSGVEITSQNSLVQAGVNTDVYITGYSGAADGAPVTLALSGSYDASTANGLFLTAYGTDSNTPPQIVLSNAVLTGSYTGVFIDSQDLGSVQMLNSKITGPGQIRLRADAVDMEVGSTIFSTSPYYNDDAIVIEGYPVDGVDQPLTRFINNAGPNALQTQGNLARWIVWANDVYDTENFQGGGLANDFVRVGAQNGTGDWSGDTGSGFVPFTSLSAFAYGGAVTRSYDGTRNAQLNPNDFQITSPNGIQSTLVDTSSVLFDTKDVGYGKNVTMAPSAFNFTDSRRGVAVPVYGMGLQTDISGQITPAQVSAQYVVADKTYDTTTTASISVTFSGLVPGESLSGTAFGAFADPHAGQGKTVFAQASLGDGANGSGLLSNYNVTTPETATGNILQAPLVIGGLTALNKVYDTTRNATLAGTASVSALGDDQVLLLGTASGSFADKNVGTAKPVSVSGLSLGGSSASDYVLVATAPGLAADITPAPLPVSGLQALNKVYDATTLATLSNTGAVQALGSDVVTVSGGVGRFSDKNVGNGKTVQVTDITLSGPDAGNYQASSADLTANITPATLSLVGLSANSRVYDSTVIASLNGTASVTPLGSDVVSVTGVASAQFVDKNVGNGKSVTLSGFGLSGTDAGNYVLITPTLSANITPATLIYVANAAGATAGDAIPALGGTVTGFVGGETQASATSGTLAFVTPATSSSAAGSYAIDGQGLAAQNYQFIQAAGNATALTLAPPPAVVPPAPPPVDQSTQVALSTLNLATTRIASAQGGVLDLTQATGAGVAATAALAVPVDGSNFGAVRLGDMSMDALAAMLDGRDRYKKALFADAVFKLEENPELADAHACTSLKEAETGTCLITADLKRESRAEEAVVAQATETAKPASGNGPTIETAPTGRQVSLPTRRHVKLAALPQIERKVALVIGVDEYQDKSIPTLGNAVNDAEAVGKLFESNLGYETVVIPNASKAAVISALNRLALAMNPKDSVVIYYAGHGDVVEATSQGYWLLSDADAKKPETWLSNADIGRLISQIGASQVALISDSCYSGSLVGDQRIRGSSASVDPTAILQQKSVVVMSSGGNEPVSDAGKQGHSPFTYSLMNQLNQVSKWQPGGNIFERVRFAVARALPQRPQYGASSAAGHQGGGDYLFEQRQLDNAGSQ